MQHIMRRGRMWVVVEPSPMKRSCVTGSLQQRVPSRDSRDDPACRAWLPCAYLDSSLQNLLLCALVSEERSLTMDGQAVRGLCRSHSREGNTVSSLADPLRFKPRPEILLSSMCTWKLPRKLRPASPSMHRLPRGPFSSMGSPMTFMIRPSVALPTGICKARAAEGRALRISGNSRKRPAGPGTAFSEERGHALYVLKQKYVDWS